MYTVFIADDETDARQHLKSLVDWQSLGFKIIGEAANGCAALSSILEATPDLAVMDLHMPDMSGTDAIGAAKRRGFKGKTIILSKSADFKYAKAAFECGACRYLTKPLRKEELVEALIDVKNQLDDEARARESFNVYREKAKIIILYDLLKGSADVDAIDVNGLGLAADAYQVVICENYNKSQTETKYRFFELLKVANEDNGAYEDVPLFQNEVILLKGCFILDKFKDFLKHYEREQKPQENSPLDSVFLAYGHKVDSLKDVHISYDEAARLLQRRFFCEDRQHTMSYEELPRLDGENAYILSAAALDEYCGRLVGYIQALKRNQVAKTLHELERNLFNSDSPVPRIKLFLIDLYLSIKEKISRLYHNSNILFPRNAEIIDYINGRFYLYEIMLYFTEQFDMIMRSIGNSSSEGVIDDIIHYIEHNYMDNIKLETIAPLFGYNSSYLGKIFNKKVGEGFNVFVDKVRIRHSKELLLNSDLKVYEISEKVGYRNVDYFHTKFKKYVEMSPAEYRKKNQNLDFDMHDAPSKIAT